MTQTLKRRESQSLAIGLLSFFKSVHLHRNRNVCSLVREQRIGLIPNHVHTNKAKDTVTVNSATMILF